MAHSATRTPKSGRRWNEPLCRRARRAASSQHKRSCLLLPRYRVKVARHNNRCNIATAVGGRWPRRHHAVYVKQRKGWKIKRAILYALSSRRFDETPSAPTSPLGQTLTRLRDALSMRLIIARRVNFFHSHTCLSSRWYLRLRLLFGALSFSIVPTLCLYSRLNLLFLYFWVQMTSMWCIEIIGELNKEFLMIRISLGNL